MGFMVLYFDRPVRLWLRGFKRFEVFILDC